VLDARAPWTSEERQRVGNRRQTDQYACMSRQTMSFALPESMREYIDNRVAAGN
jgi:hypothetical protein